jgi:hypothetical protein
VLDRGASDRLSLERRVFHFLAPLGATGRAAHFLRLDSAWGAAAGTVNGFMFDAAVLTACLGRPADWKLRHGFPMDVTAVVGPGAPPAGPVPEWQRVILVRPEHVAVLLVLAPASTGGERLLGFPVRTGVWTLESVGPVFVLQAGWQEAFPELPNEPPPASWRQAWRAWCQPRSIPSAEAEACMLERQSYRLLVRAPKRLVERLRTARSDALKGEAWVLAGSGAIAPLALLEIMEAGAAA